MGYYVFPSIIFFTLLTSEAHCVVYVGCLVYQTEPILQMVWTSYKCWKMKVIQVHDEPVRWSVPQIKLEALSNFTSKRASLLAISNDDHTQDFTPTYRVCKQT